jgi:hypothetical protein
VVHPENLLTLHNLGRLYGQRPSTFLGLDDAWLAYQVDVAAAQASLRMEQGQKYAPLAAAARKIAVPASGIW